DFSLALCDRHVSPTGERPVYKQQSVSPLSAPAHCFVWLCIAQPYKTVCLQWKAPTQHTVKQHTVNPLFAPHVNPFLPSAVSTVSLLFMSTDHCIGVTGDVSDTKSIPPSVRMPAAVWL
ncbi:unnamed protein product, partial [Staurois parvus]